LNQQCRESLEPGNEIQEAEVTDRMLYPENDPRHHTAKIKVMLSESMQHMREDVSKVDDPKAQALFETSAEVLGGLIAAYTHFEQREESAWKQQGQ
jgi:hypothetical protein